jgi:hypothetical protein
MTPNPGGRKQKRRRYGGAKVLGEKEIKRTKIRQYNAIQFFF